MEDITKEELIRFLKKVVADISGINHQSKSDNAYQRLGDIVRDIDYKLVSYYRLDWEQLKISSFTKDISLSAKILSHYSHKASDKRKSELISEFKKEYLYDLRDLVFKLEYVSNSDSFRQE